MDKFARLNTVQEHILELLLGDETLSGEYEDDFNKAEKYRDKMSQLSAELDVSGSKMFRLVSSFPPTKENYRKAVQQVKERFGREDLLVQIYIRDFLGLVMQNATGKIRLELSELYDVLKSKLLALESLGRTNAETTSEGQDSGRSLDRLMTFLRKEVESEEMILLARTGLGSTQRQKVKPNAEEPSLATSTALVNTKGDRSGKPRSCLFCSQSNHWTSDRLIAKTLSLNDKKKYFN
ncbi:putative RNA-directed DNA polymerase from transposon X-element [Trichonephila clavipes]|nr:putative RNA-directed DNA polymerase from transposon X-element [Trichonephila clavipes]